MLIPNLLFDYFCIFFSITFFAFLSSLPVTNCNLQSFINRLRVRETQSHFFFAKIKQSHISQAQLRSSVRHADSGEIVVDLPKGERARFPLLFLELESTDARSRGVGDIGLSMSTLEEVFLSLAEANEQQLGDAKDGSAVPPLMSNGKAAVGDSNALRAQFRGGGGTLAEDEGGTSPPPASLDTDPKDGDVAITAVETPDNGDALVALTKHERGEPSFLRSLVAMTWTRLIMCARKPIRVSWSQYWLLVTYGQPNFQCLHWRLSRQCGNMHSP